MFVTIYAISRHKDTIFLDTYKIKIKQNEVKNRLYEVTQNLYNLTDYRVYRRMP